MKAIGGLLLVGVPATAWVGSVGLAAKEGQTWLVVLQVAATVMIAVVTSRD